MTTLQLHTRRALQALGVAALLAGAASPGLAQNSAASVSFTSLSYQLSGGSLTWSNAAAYQTLYTQATDGGGLTGFDSKSSDAANYLPASVTANTVNSTATATSRTGQTVAVGAISRPSTGAAFSLPSDSFASASTSGEFTLSQAGTVTFLAAYTLSVAGAAGNSSDRYAEALAQLTIGSNVSPSAGGIATDDRFSYNETGGTATRTGTLSLTMTLGAGEVGYYNLYANASAVAPITAVPEPAAWSTMLIGLAAMVGVGLRRRKTAARG